MHVDWSLLLKYFQKRCSEEELLQIEKWRSTDPDHQRFFEEMSDIWEKSGDLYRNYEINSVMGWEKLSKKLSLKTGRVKGKEFNTRILLRWAAILVLLISIGTITTIIFMKHEMFVPEISFQSGTKKVDIRLPDSSFVTLDRNSSLHYQRNFKGSLREVKLKGTAYFVIKPDKLKPFIVNMSSCAVKVVGTSFYLSSDSILKKVTLVVASGKVHFYSTSQKDSFVIVSKNEEAVYTESNRKVIKQQSYNPNAIVWKTGDFIFEAEKLQNVCNILSSYYAEKISISDSSLLGLRLTAGFHNQQLTEIVKAIETTLDIQAHKVGQTIVLSKKLDSD
jgi:transmembrane sensor